METKRQHWYDLATIAMIATVHIPDYGLTVLKKIILAFSYEDNLSYAIENRLCILLCVLKKRAGFEHGMPDSLIYQTTS